MVQLIKKAQQLNIKSLGLLSIIALAGYALSSSILEASYIKSKFPVPYFVQQTSFDAVKMKAWYASMINQGTFDIYFQTQLIDFLFIITVFFAGFLLWTFVANCFVENSFFNKIGRKMAFALPIAAGFDVLENMVSFFMIANPAGFADALVLPYSAFAVIKFGFWTIGLAWLLISLMALPVVKLLKNKKWMTTAILVGGLSIVGYTQDNSLLYSNQLTVVTGISQPLLLNGVNLAVNYTTNRLVFEYSHGMSLEYAGEILRPAYRDKVLSIKSPYSTGAGVGYRIFAKKIIAMDIRTEAKVHQYDVALTQTQEISYTNFDVGTGVYWQVRPFGKSKHKGLRGIVIEPSIRYWKNVKSTLEKDFTYRTANDEVEIHEPYPLDLFVNISVGYTFGM